jgi:hypothetical protein
MPWYSQYVIISKLTVCEHCQKSASGFRNAMNGSPAPVAGAAAAAAPAAIYKSHAPPDARAYLSIVDCPAFLQAVADGNTGAVEEFHNDGVGKLNKVT